MYSQETTVFPGEKFGADGDQATATAMQAIKDAAGEEERQRVAEKASKKAAFNAEYDVGERCCAVLCMLCMVAWSVCYAMPCFACCVWTCGLCARLSHALHAVRRCVVCVLCCAVLCMLCVDVWPVCCAVPCFACCACMCGLCAMLCLDLMKARRAAIRR